jgi:hypothetical protein
MGLFDWFLSEDKQIQRHVRRLTNRDAQAEDRDASARWLAQKATPQAIIGLLQRYDLNLEHQMKDSGEKDVVYGLLRDLGDKVLEPAKAWLLSGRQIAMPLKLVADVAGKEKAIEYAFAILEHERKKDDFKPDKKKAVFVWLTDQRHPGIVDAVSPFFEDFDEGVRYSAAETLIAQGDVSRAALLTQLAAGKEESNRVVVRICSAFAQRGWPIEGAAVAVPSGFKLADGRIVAG